MSRFFPMTSYAVVHVLHWNVIRWLLSPLKPCSAVSHIRLKLCCCDFPNQRLIMTCVSCACDKLLLTMLTVKRRSKRSEWTAAPCLYNRFWVGQLLLMSCASTMLPFTAELKKELILRYFLIKDFLCILAAILSFLFISGFLLHWFKIRMGSY